MGPHHGFTWGIGLLMCALVVGVAKLVEVVPPDVWPQIALWAAVLAALIIPIAFFARTNRRSASADSAVRAAKPVVPSRSHDDDVDDDSAHEEHDEYTTLPFDSPLGRIEVSEQYYIPFIVLVAKRPQLAKRFSAYILNSFVFNSVLLMAYSVLLMSLTQVTFTGMLVDLSVMMLCAYVIEHSMLLDTFAPLRWIMTVLRPLSKNLLHMAAPLCMAIWGCGDVAACLPVYGAYAVCATFRFIVMLCSKTTLNVRAPINANRFLQHYTFKYSGEILRELHIIAANPNDPRRQFISANDTFSIADCVIANKGRAVSPSIRFFAIVALLYILFEFAVGALVHVAFSYTPPQNSRAPYDDSVVISALGQFDVDSSLLAVSPQIDTSTGSPRIIHTVTPIVDGSFDDDNGFSLQPTFSIAETIRGQSHSFDDMRYTLLIEIDKPRKIKAIKFTVGDDWWEYSFEPDTEYARYSIDITGDDEDFLRAISRASKVTVRAKDTAGERHYFYPTTANLQMLSDLYSVCGQYGFFE